MRQKPLPSKRLDLTSAFLPLVNADRPVALDLGDWRRAIGVGRNVSGCLSA